MNLEGKTRTEWRKEIDRTFQIYLEHQEDEILAENFSALQMMYHAFYKHWYMPKLPNYQSLAIVRDSD